MPCDACARAPRPAVQNPVWQRAAQALGRAGFRQSRLAGTLGPRLALIRRLRRCGDDEGHHQERCDHTCSHNASHNAFLSHRRTASLLAVGRLTWRRCLPLHGITLRPSAGFLTAGDLLRACLVGRLILPSFVGMDSVVGRVALLRVAHGNLAEIPEDKFREGAIVPGNDGHPAVGGSGTGPPVPTLTFGNSNGEVGIRVLLAAFVRTAMLANPDRPRPWRRAARAKPAIVRLRQDSRSTKKVRRFHDLSPAVLGGAFLCGNSTAFFSGPATASRAPRRKRSAIDRVESRRAAGEGSSTAAWPPVPFDYSWAGAKPNSAGVIAKCQIAALTGPCGRTRRIRPAADP
jgi:hypothetical protein